MGATVTAGFVPTSACMRTRTAPRLSRLPGEWSAVLLRLSTQAGNVEPLHSRPAAFGLPSLPLQLHTLLHHSCIRPLPPHLSGGVALAQRGGAVLHRLVVDGDGKGHADLVGPRVPGGGWGL